MQSWKNIAQHCTDKYIPGLHSKITVLVSCRSGPRCCATRLARAGSTMKCLIFLQACARRTLSSISPKSKKSYWHRGRRWPCKKDINAHNRSTGIVSEKAQDMQKKNNLEFYLSFSVSALFSRCSGNLKNLQPQKQQNMQVYCRFFLSEVLKECRYCQIIVVKIELIIVHNYARYFIFFK